MLWRYGSPICLRRAQQYSSPLRGTTVNRLVLRSPQASSCQRYASSQAAIDTSDEQHATPSESQHSTSHTPTGSRWSHAALTSKPPLDTNIQVAGLIRSIRKQKNIAFAAISDGSTLQPLQAVLSPSDAKDLHNGAYVELLGIWRASQGKAQDYELAVENVLNIGSADVEASPIQKKNMTVDHLRNYPHMRLRLPLYQLLTRVRSQVLSSIHRFYADALFPQSAATYVQPPIITSSDCEGAGEVFTVSPKLAASPHASIGQGQGQGQEESHYFRTPKYLTVSSQLHLETFSAEVGDVWTLTPAFRAEESDTGRHLAELWMVEAEFRSIDGLDGLLSNIENLIRSIVTDLRASRVGTELENFYSHDKKHSLNTDDQPDLPSRWNALVKDNWPRTTYQHAVTELGKASAATPNLFKQHPSWTSGLHLEHEKWIVANLGNNGPIFVTHYPKAQKPFYMLTDTDTDTASTHEQNDDVVANFDLLLLEVSEVAGGSLREHRLENLILNMREKGLLKGSATAEDAKDLEAESTSNDQLPAYPHLLPTESLGTLQYYADLRRYGSSPHGGFGLGLDRLLMYLTGVANVRDIVPYPRTFRNCVA